MIRTLAHEKKEARVWIRSPFNDCDYHLSADHFARHCYFCPRAGVDGYCNTHEPLRQFEARDGDVIVPRYGNG